MPKKDEVKHLEPVKFTDADGNSLTLWFTRATVSKMERDGISNEKLMEILETNPLEAHSKLCWYAMLAFQPDATLADADAFVEDIGMETAGELLSDLYIYTYETLRKGKNAIWTMAKR